MKIQLFIGLLLCACMHVSYVLPLNILFVVDFFPKMTETFILNQIARLMDSKKHDIWIHSYNRGKQNESCSVIKDYNLLERTSYGPVYPYDLDEFDILYCQFGMVGHKMLQQKKQQKSNAKLVTCFRGYDITCQLQKNPRSYTTLLAEGDLFLPVCECFAQKLINLGADPHKVIVHHSAIDCSMFCYKDRDYSETQPVHMVSVSRLIEKKGIEDVIRALALVVKQCKNIHYTIVGDGSLRKNLEKLVHSLGLQDYVTFLGSILHERVVSIFENADLAILPSKKGRGGDQEGIPNVLKEAMAVGLPVISTYHAGIPELVEHGCSGFLVHEGDIQGLAESILYLVEHPNTRASMGVAGREKVEKEFNIDALIPCLEEYFYTLLSK